MQRALCRQLHHFQCPLPEFRIPVCNKLMMMMIVTRIIMIIMIVMMVKMMMGSHLILGLKSWYYGSSDVESESRYMA